MSNKNIQNINIVENFVNEIKNIMQNNKKNLSKNDEKEIQTIIRNWKKILYIFWDK